MPQIHVCGHGHRWDPTQDERPDEQARWTVCPVCGASVEMFSLRDTASSAGEPFDTEAIIPAGNPTIPGYEILGVVGYGGTGVVYKALHVPSGQTVALKMLSAGLRARPKDLARFEREAQAIAKIHHPHIVDIHDVGRHEGLPYVALEFMDKGSLSEATRGNPLPPRVAAEMVELLAQAIQAAHEQGIIHRDLKPANVLLQSVPPSLDPAHRSFATLQLLGVPKVADFGLAKRLDDEATQTRTGAIVGTPSYMAPEQAMGKSKDVGPSVDVYALGAILYECLVGRPPFKAPTVLETLDLVRSEDPVAPSALQGGIPRNLETICLKCLDKSPTHRYVSAGAVAADLRRYLDGQSIQARPTPSWRRVLRVVERHALVATLVLFAFTSVAMGFALLYRRPARAGAGDANVVTTAYYSNFVKRRGVPEGIGALTEAQVRRRELSFRFYLRGKQVEKVEAIDRRGRLNVRHGILTHLAPPDALSFFTTTPGIDFSRLSLSGTTAFVGNLARDAGACSWEYQRDRDGNLVKEIARDVAGRILWTFQLTSADTGHYTDERGFILSRASSGAAYVKLFYTPDGLEKEVRYLARTGKPRPDAAGIFGRRFEHDHHGMITAVTFLGPRDRPVLHSLGLARITRRWDERGQLLEEAYLDLNGNPARGRFGRGSRVTWTYDEDGNPTSEEVVGLDGSSSSRKSQFTYEKQGNLKTSEVRFSPGEGQPERLTRTVYEYDSDDNCILIRSFDAAGQPIIGTSTGSAGQALGYDEQGRITSVTFLGTDGKPAEAAPDPERPYRRRGKEVRIVYTYNERDQVLSESLFGLDDNPATDAFGVARYTCTYDDAGRPTELQRNGPDGKPLPSERGFTRRTWKYDEQGRLEETASYDADGDLILVPVPSSDSPTVPRSTSLVGIFLLSRAMRTANFAGGRVTLAYDDHGNLANVTLHGPDGESLTDAEGFTRVEAKYDDLGNLAELTTFASEGRPKANRNGVARMTWTHDGFGNLTQIATFGPEGQRVASVYGVARHTRQYDEQYNLVEEAFFGTDDKLTLGTFGYARARFKYDGESNLISSAYTDIEGKSVATRPVWLYRADRTNPLDMAADLRLEAGDVLLTYAGEQVRCARMFLQRKRLERQGGERKELRILRNGKTLTLKIPAGALRLDDFFRFSRTGPLPASRIPGRLEPIRVIETRGESSIAEMR